MKYLCDNCSPQIGCICRFENKKTECDTYVPMNNEQYIRFCSTEQLAEWLAERMDTPCDICRYDCRSKCMANAKQVWLEWLKE